MPRRITPEGVLVARYNTPREEWLQLRQQGIGGSDALAVLGLDRYRTRMEVYLDKTGQLPEREATDRMLWGQMVEAAIGQWFTKKTGIKVRRCGILRHIERGWQQVSVDFLTEDGGLLEIKNRSRYVVREWDDDQVDDGAEAQGQHGLAVTGLKHAWFCAQLAGEPPEIRRVERNDDLITDMNALEADFWELVTTRTAPALEGRASARLIKALFPGAESGKCAEIDAETLAILRDSKLAGQEEAAAKRRKEELAARVQLVAGDAEVLTCEGRVVATWKNSGGRRSADFDLLERDFPAAYQAAVSCTPGRRFLNKLTDEGEIPAEKTTRKAA